MNLLGWRSGWAVLRRVSATGSAGARRGPPAGGGIYTGAALTEGGATASVVTGADVATTVSGGTTAGVAVGAVAGDAATSLALLGRIVADVASQYGYDVREPDEVAFALGVISVGSATTPAMKLAALCSLSRLTQQMMRRATWAQLNKHGLVQAGAGHIQRTRSSL